MDIKINNRKIGPRQPVYIVAEMSANHNHDFNQAVDIIKAAKAAGADAIKLQTYTPDTLTINCDNDYFKIKGTIWQGKTLYDLYDEAQTPWEWHPRLQKIASNLGLDFFSTPFDASAVDFLEEMDVPVYKIASFELIDLPLLKKIGATRKPVIMSTGMASLAEIDEAVCTLREAGTNKLILLKCVSAYPAPLADMNLRTIPHMTEAFDVPVGLSDHSMGTSVAVAAVTLGACVVEKHFTLSRSIPGPDSIFSLEPNEFQDMVTAIRQTEKTIGKVSYKTTEQERHSRVFRRSLFVVRDLAAGELFTPENVRSIRPGYGLAPKYMEVVLGKKAVVDLQRGTPLSWKVVH